MKPEFSVYYSVTKNSQTVNSHLWCQLLHCLAGKRHRFFCNQTGVPRQYQNVTYWCEFMVLGKKKKIDPITLVPLVAYHTLTFI